jgi:hypothetical protein
MTVSFKHRVLQSNAVDPKSKCERRFPDAPVVGFRGYPPKTEPTKHVVAKAKIIGPAMRDPKDGAYHYAYGTKYTHDDVIASLEDKYPDRAPFSDWTRGYVDVRLCFRIEP